MSGFSIPYLPYDRIRETANEFLQKYHPSGTISVPIEEIVEFKMGFNIVPMPGLQDALENDGSEVLGFTSYNLKEITVDQWIWQHRPGRYRFTLAHEVGHVVMHRELYESADFHTIEGWKKFINGIPDKIHGRYEWQAYAFAGLVLVPRDPLKEAVDKHLKAILKLLEKEKISLSEAWESIWDQVYELAARDFEVSPEVIQRRIAYDKLQDMFQFGISK